jgi:cytochrome oxidase Cu insertion factor (SCO1/SenC/PrrC family)
MEVKMNKSKRMFLILSTLLLATLIGDQSVSATSSQVKRRRSTTTVQTSTPVAYTCPMHPEVKSRRAGKCPKCGMALRPAVKSEATPGSVQNTDNSSGVANSTNMRIPDTTVYDQNGRQLHFYSDLVKGKTVAINFVFTTCTGVCPTLTAKFRQLQQYLGERVGRDIRLISISVDPTTDVPERLNAYAEKFKAGPGWTFVTGSKPEIDELLRALGSFAADKNKHPQMILIGNEPAAYWTRAFGLSSASQLSGIVKETADNHAGKSKAPEDVSGKDEKTSATEDASAYFTNLTLLTQDNKPIHFYQDMLKGKVVLINFMFTTCKGVCSPMTANLAKVQRFLGERVGREINMISISVDPLTDTVPVLKRYANNFKTLPGWYFLTGKKENVDWVLYKLGGYTEDKSDHTSLLVLGNEATGEWTKVPAMANPADIANMAVKLTESKNLSQVK